MPVLLQYKNSRAIAIIVFMSGKAGYVRSWPSRYSELREIQSP